MSTKLKIYRMDDCDWWIGESAQSCIDDRLETYGPDDDFDKESVYELSEKDLRSMVFNCESGERYSFAKQLEIEIANGGEFPRLFATTEF